MRRLLVLSLFTLSACGSAPPRQSKADEPVAISPPASTQDPQSPPAAASTPTPTAANTTYPPKTEPNGDLKQPHPAGAQAGPMTTQPGPHLGSPCDRADTTHCGKLGRVAVQRNESYSMAVRSNLPCTLSPVSAEQNGFVFKACVAEGQVHASGECIMCRLMGAGWSVIGDIDQMTLAQSDDLQKRLGLPTKPALHSEAAWRAAIAAAASKAKP